jgi:predicted transglutaminase-like cysteine proteinase
MSKYRILMVAITTVIALPQSMIASRALGAEDGSTIEQALDASDAPLLDAPNFTPAAPRTANIPARFFTINQVLAKQGRQSAPSAVVRLASLQPSASVVDAPTNVAATARGEEPFGLFTFRAPEGQLWMKWRQVSAAIRGEMRQIAACREEEESCSLPARRFASLIDTASRKTGRQRYELVNRAINAAVRYASDFNNHGVADKWSAPLATLSSGRGDCEDYAIAKYVALLEAGTPKRDLRLVLVHDRLSRQHHAVLAARQDGQWLVLDNRWSELRPDSQTDLTPLFAITSEEVKLFAAPYSMRAIYRQSIPTAAALVD